MTDDGNLIVVISAFIYGMAGLGVTYMVHNIGGSLMQVMSV